MEMEIMVKVRKILLMLTFFSFAGCSSVPRDSPMFLKENASLVENRMEVLATAIETSSSSAKKSLESVDYVRELLAAEKIDKTAIRGQLKIIEQTLLDAAKLGALPAKAREDAAFVAGNLEMMSNILQQQVDFSSLVKDLRSKYKDLSKGAQNGQ